MTNRLLSDWWLSIKYVDDTSALEIIPRNSPSVLNVVASDGHNFATARNTRLNPTKCKEIHINSNCLINPIIIHMKKLLDSDWPRAVQFKCNTSAKSVTPVQKV